MKKFNIIFIIIISLIILGTGFFLDKGGLFLLDWSFFPADFLSISLGTKSFFWLMLDFFNYALGYQFTSRIIFILIFLTTVFFGFRIGNIANQISGEKNKYVYPAQMLGIIFFIINPFFYERMATQPGVFLGTLFFGFGLGNLLKSILQEKNLVMSYIFFGLGVMVLPHSIFFVIAALIVFFAITKTNFKKALRQILNTGVVIFLMNANIIVYGILTLNTSEFDFFNYSNLDNFKTNNLIGGVDYTTANLYGFWGENYARIALPQQINPNRYIAGFIITALSIAGIIILIKSKNEKTKKIGKLLAVLMIISRILSGGIASNLFGRLVGYLYKIIPLYYGFRDSSKRNGVLMIIYGIGFCVALSKIFEKIIFSSKPYKFLFKSEKANYMLFLVITTLALFSWVPAISLGFRGQLRIAQYPSQYKEIKTKLINEGLSDKKFLALPRDSYMACSRNGKISPNLMGEMFKPLNLEIADNIQIGYLYSNKNDEKSKDILYFTKQHDASMIKRHGFDYIIFFENCGNYTGYDFLTGNESLQKIEGNEYVSIYQIK